MSEFRLQRRPPADIIPEFPQRQDSLTDQLNDLTAVATKLGMHDAVQWIQDQLSADKCPECNGHGLAFYALRGMDRCDRCNGTGRKK